MSKTIARIGPRTGRLFLREWRKYRALTQEQLAERLGTTKTTISRHESRKRDVTVEHLAQLADALNTDVANLFRDPHQPSADDLLRDASPTLFRQAIALIETLKRTGT